MAKEGTSRLRSQKVRWHAVNNKLYIALAYEQVLKGNRTGTALTKVGWKNLRSEFNRRTKNSYDMKKFKNYHNRLRDKWKIWDKMINKSTGFQYDPVLKTVTASDELWDDFIKANPDASIFRGMPFEHHKELEVIFSSTMATTEPVLPLNARRPEHESPYGSQTPPEHIKDQNRVDEENVPSSQMDLDEQDDEEDGTGGSPAVGETRHPRIGESEESLSSQRPMKEAKGPIYDTYLQTMARYFEWKMSERSKQDALSISACIKRLNELPGLERGNSTWLFALDLLSKAENRETFMSIIDDAENCLAWIQSKMQV